jgi:peptidyl-prolyl cis-trans isomerase A (cyclophilin A)
MKAFALLTILAISAFGQAPATKAPAKAATKGAVTPRANPALLNPALAVAKAPETFKVQFTTTKGDVIIELHREWAPLGVDRFYNLTRIGYFNGAAFFRIVPRFVTQWGLNGNPAVNKVWTNRNIKDDAVKQSNKKGLVSFASAGPNTRSTQLFINLVDNPRLDGMGFAPIGQVVQGMEIVESFYAGYGESPDQEAITNKGKAYLDATFPNLDKITLGKVIAPPPAPGATKAPAKAATKATTPAAAPKN